MSDERTARMCLAAAVEPGSAGLARLVALHGPEEVWRSLRDGEGRDGWAARAQALDVDQLLASADRARARVVVPGDDEWPDALGALATIEPWAGVGGEPLCLWLRGDGRLRADGVAIVGARASSPYGELVAADLGHDLARAGLPVVSGGAFGIDTAAHRGALAAQGQTLAVLACGVDRPYPSANATLFRTIRESGGVLVSEHPPGAHPTRARFLARNRLIAALAQGTVIVEAGSRSGARNTVSWAGRLGRVVMAVPGPVTSAGSVTPHRLVREGQALLVSSATEVRDAVARIGQDTLVEAEGDVRVYDALAPDERAVAETIPSRGSIVVDELVGATGLRPPTVLAALTQLEELGLVEERADGGWGLGRRRADERTRGPRASRNASTCAG